MEFKANELSNVIAKCVRFTSTRGLLPEYAYLAIRDGHVIATKGSISIRYKNPLASEEPFILPAEMFGRLLSSFLESKVILTDMDKYANLRAEGSDYKLPHLPNNSIFEDQYSDFVDNIPEDSLFIPLPDEFGEGLKKLLFSVPKEEKIKESLRGINYDGKSFIASDNIILSKFIPQLGLDSEFFIPVQLLEHLIEDKPISYCVTETGIEMQRRAYFLFKDYLISATIKRVAFPLGSEIFDKIRERKPESMSISVSPEVLMPKLDRIAIVAEQYLNRVNIIAFKDEMILFASTPAGAEAIEIVPITSTLPGDEEAGFVAIDLTYLKKGIEFSSDFFFTPDFVYFSKDGLDSILKPMGVEDGGKIMEKVAEYVAKRGESGSTGVVGGTNSQETEKENTVS